MHIEWLWLSDWRCWEVAELTPSTSGITLLTGPNGAGKTNVLEALAWLARGESFRAVPRDVLVRGGTHQAVVRGRFDSGGRALLVEAECNVPGRDRVLVNRQVVRHRRDAQASVPVTVFTPDDLSLVKGPPAQRRAVLDETASSISAAFGRARAGLDRVLRQRAILLHQAAGRLTAEINDTLVVWDRQLTSLGEEVAAGREALVAALVPAFESAYGQVAGERGSVSLAYARSWSGELGTALVAHREEDLRRRATSIGPHRDELVILHAGKLARSHASQGEQRTLALALRLATHALVEERSGTAPILLLDDVLSELDDHRAAALVELVPPTQVILAAASPPPLGIDVAATIDIREIGRRASATGDTFASGALADDGDPSPVCAGSVEP
jgi:DNA replication and repair protein RecF